MSNVQLNPSASKVFNFTIYEKPIIYFEIYQYSKSNAIDVTNDMVI